MFEYLHFERFCGLNVYVDCQLNDHEQKVLFLNLLPVFIFATEIICHLNVIFWKAESSTCLCECEQVQSPSVTHFSY